MQVRSTLPVLFKNNWVMWLNSLLPTCFISSCSLLRCRLNDIKDIPQLLGYLFHSNFAFLVYANVCMIASVGLDASINATWPWTFQICNQDQNWIFAIAYIIHCSSTLRVELDRVEFPPPQICGITSPRIGSVENVCSEWRNLLAKGTPFYSVTSFCFRTFSTNQDSMKLERYGIVVRTHHLFLFFWPLLYAFKPSILGQELEKQF